MLLLYRWCIPPKDALLFNKLIKREVQMLSYLSSHTSEKFKVNSPEKTGFRVQLSNSIHLTKVNNDVGTGLGKIGAGLSGIGVGLVGCGIGYTAGNTIQALGRNPSAPLTPLFFVAAGLIEGLALFTLMFGVFVLSS